MAVASGAGGDKVKPETSYTFTSVEQCEDTLLCKSRCVSSPTLCGPHPLCEGAGGRDQVWKKRVALLMEEGGSYSRLRS